MSCECELGNTSRREQILVWILVERVKAYLLTYLLSSSTLGNYPTEVTSREGCITKTQRIN